MRMVDGPTQSARICFVTHYLYMIEVAHKLEDCLHQCVAVHILRDKDSVLSAEYVREPRQRVNHCLAFFSILLSHGAVVSAR